MQQTGVQTPISKQVLFAFAFAPLWLMSSVKSVHGWTPLESFALFQAYVYLWGWAAGLPIYLLLRSLRLGHIAVFAAAGVLLSLLADYVLWHLVPATRGLPHHFPFAGLAIQGGLAGITIWYMTRRHAGKA